MDASAGESPHDRMDRNSRNWYTERKKNGNGHMAEHIADNLWRLDIPLEGNPLKNLNSYLIVGEERSLLIDTGFRWTSCRLAMERELAEVGVDQSRMDVFATHLHSDHVGLAPELIRELGLGGNRLTFYCGDKEALEEVFSTLLK